MTTTWTVKSTTERVDLDAAGRAAATFTVTNDGPVDQRLVFDVVPGDVAKRDWFNIAKPNVVVTHGASTTFLVDITVPAGIPAGPHWFAGRAYSADHAPEETSVVSDRVAFEVRPAAAPVPWWRGWGWLLAVAAVVHVVLLVVVFLILSGDRSESTVSPLPTPLNVHKSAPLVIIQTWSADLDEIMGSEESKVDIRFEAVTETERFITPLAGVQLAAVGHPADRALACVAASLSGERIPIGGLTAGDVVCVRTNEGRLSTLTVFEPVGPSPGQLRLFVTTYQT